MSRVDSPRRSFIKLMIALPSGLTALSQGPSPSRTVIKVDAGSGRLNEFTKLPGGDLHYVKVEPTISTHDSRVFHNFSIIYDGHFKLFQTTA